MPYGSEEANQLFGWQNAPDKNQQFLDQTSRQQDMNHANNQWLAEEQLQNTRTAMAGLQHGVDTGISQYNTSTDRANQQQQRGIENSNNAQRLGMDKTRLGMEQTRAGLENTGMQQQNDQGKLTLQKLQEEEAYQNQAGPGGVSPRTAARQWDAGQYGEGGRNQTSYNLGNQEMLARIGSEKANAGATADARRQGNVTFNQSQDDRGVDQLAQGIIAARAKGDQIGEQQALTNARNGPTPLTPTQVSMAQAKAGAMMKQSQNTADLLEQTKPDVMAFNNDAAKAREKLSVLADATRAANVYTHQTLGSPEEATAKANLVGSLRSVGKNGEADLIEGNGPNQIRLLGGQTVGTNGMQSETSRVKAALTSLQTETASEIKQLEGRAGTTPSPTVARQIQALKANLLSLQQEAATQTHDGKVNAFNGGGKAISNGSVFEQQNAAAPFSAIPGGNALPVSFQGNQPSAQNPGNPSARHMIGGR